MAILVNGLHGMGSDAFSGKRQVSCMPRSADRAGRKYGRGWEECISLAKNK